MREIRAAPPEHHGWLVERVGCAVTSGFRAIEIVDGDRILAMIGFDHWWPNAAQMHFASDEKGAGLELAPAAFDYVFRQAGKDVVIGWMPMNEERLLRIARAIGFREVRRVKDGWGKGTDVAMLELRKEHCTLLPKGER